MADFQTFTYQQKLEDNTPHYFEHFTSEYHGFNYTKSPDYQLYYITPRDGQVLPSELACRFTKIILLEQTVDRHLLRQEIANGPPVPKPKVKVKRLVVVDGRTVEIEAEE